MSASSFCMMWFDTGEIEMYDWNTDRFFTIAGETLWRLISTLYFKLFKSLASNCVNTIKASLLSSHWALHRGRYTIQFSWLEQWKFLFPSIICHRNIIMPHSNYTLIANAEDPHEKTTLHKLEMKWVETSWNSCLDFIKLFIHVFMRIVRIVSIVCHVLH